MDADLNKYDLEHAVTDHPTMSAGGAGGDLSGGVVALLHAASTSRRCCGARSATNIPLMSFVKVLVQFTTMMQVEKVHPLQSGLFRLKHIASAGPDCRREPCVAFYPRFALDRWSPTTSSWCRPSGGCSASSAGSSATRTGSPIRTRRSRRCATTTRRRSISSPRPPAGGPPSAHQKKIDELTHAAVG